MERGQKLLKAIEQRGYNIMSLSKASGVPYTTIRSMIERNLTNASIDNVIRICKTLGISVETIAKDNGEDISEEEGEQKFDNSLSIPLYGSIAAGALASVDPVTPSNVEYIQIPNKIVGYTGNGQLFALKVNGESMNKIIPNGSYVICKPVDIDGIKNGDIVIFSHDNEFSMKRFIRNDRDEVLIFRAESTDWRFSDIVIPYQTQNDLKIYAKVIWYSVRLS